MTEPGRRNLILTDVLIPELDKKGLREFGLVTGAMIAGLFGVIFPWIFELRFPIWPWIVFALLAVWGVAAPNTLRPVHYWWMRFALLLSKVTTPIILGIVFYLVFTPMGIVMRLLGNDPMHRDKDDALDTYRVQPTKSGATNLEKPF